MGEIRSWMAQVCACALAGAVLMAGACSDGPSSPSLDRSTVAPDRGSTDQVATAPADHRVTLPDQGALPAQPGFGDKCSVTNPCSDLHMTCQRGNKGVPDGFCTLACAAPGGACSGAPTGTAARCLLQFEGGGYVCGFVCAERDAAGNVQTFPCPSQLTCDVAESPAGSGRKFCVP